MSAREHQQKLQNEREEYLRKKATDRCFQQRADFAKKLKLADERGKKLPEKDYVALQSVD